MNEKEKGRSHTQKRSVKSKSRVKQEISFLQKACEKR